MLLIDLTGVQPPRLRNLTAPPPPPASSTKSGAYPQPEQPEWGAAATFCYPQPACGPWAVVCVLGCVIVFHGRARASIQHVCSPADIEHQVKHSTMHMFA